MKAEVDKAARDKLKTVPADLSKLAIVTDNDVVKKSDVNVIDINGFVLKTQYKTDKSVPEKNIYKENKIKKYLIPDTNKKQIITQKLLR